MGKKSEAIVLPHNCHSPCQNLTSAKESNDEYQVETTAKAENQGRQNKEENYLQFYFQCIIVANCNDVK